MTNISACVCHYEGATSTLCNDNGKCSCKANIIGNKCTDCKSGYFKFPDCTSNIFQNAFHYESPVFYHFL